MLPSSPWLLRVVAVLALLGSPAAFAQSLEALPAAVEAGTVYVSLQPLARALGVVATPNANSLTWRGHQGVVTFFDAAPEALLQAASGGEPQEWSLSAPVHVVGNEWFVPLDALQLLGLALPTNLGSAPTSLTLPGGRDVRLEYRASITTGLAANGAGGAAADDPTGSGDPGGSSEMLALSRAGWELADVGTALPALRFFDDNGVSLMLVDMVLVPLAFPELTKLVDAAADAAAAASGDQPLLLLVTALHPSEWPARLRFVQGERTLEVDHPYRLLLQLGSAEKVSPTAPAAGVVLLPPGFNLYRPLRVEWGGVSAEVTFRN